MMRLLGCGSKPPVKEAEDKPPCGLYPKNIATVCKTLNEITSRARDGGLEIAVYLLIKTLVTQLEDVSKIGPDSEDKHKADLLRSCDEVLTACGPHHDLGRHDATLAMRAVRDITDALSLGKGDRKSMLDRLIARQALVDCGDEKEDDAPPAYELPPPYEVAVRPVLSAVERQAWNPALDPVRTQIMRSGEICRLEGVRLERAGADPSNWGFGQDIGNSYCYFVGKMSKRLENLPARDDWTKSQQCKELIEVLLEIETMADQAMDLETGLRRIAQEGRAMSQALGVKLPRPW